MIFRTQAAQLGAQVGGVVDNITMLLSSVILAAINIAVSAHLLTYVLPIDVGGEDFFTIHLPPTFHLSIKGKQVVAGFCSFAISLLIVSTTLARYSQTVFIQNTEATQSKWIAVQLMAALLSVTAC